METISKITTEEELIGVHTEAMCRDNHYVELADCFLIPGYWFVDHNGALTEDGTPKFLFIPKPVVPIYRIVDATPAPENQLTLFLETTERERREVSPSIN